MPHYTDLAPGRLEEKDELKNRRLAEWILQKTGWSSGSHHTKPPPSQNGCSSKNCSSNHPGSKDLWLLFCLFLHLCMVVSPPAGGKLCSRDRIPTKTVIVSLLSMHCVCSGKQLKSWRAHTYKDEHCLPPTAVYSVPAIIWKVKECIPTKTSAVSLLTAVYTVTAIIWKVKERIPTKTKRCLPPTGSVLYSVPTIILKVKECIPTKTSAVSLLTAVYSVPAIN